jgi:hypothetical protein
MSLAASVGRKGQAYVSEESAFGTVLTPQVVTNAYRHLNLDLSWDPFARVASAEKKATPGTLDRYSRRAKASWALKDSYLIPSGTVQTKPEASVLLKNGFGSERAVALSTTVASSPTTAGATLTSATGLQIGDTLEIISTGSTPGTFMVVIATVNTGTGVTTWLPALPSAPNTSDVVKGCVTYNFTTDLVKTVTWGHYLGTVFMRQLAGCAVDKMNFLLDGMQEIKWNASGPAQQQIRPAPTQPAGFTTVGTTIPTGFQVQSVLISGVAVKALKATFQVSNAFIVRNEDFQNSPLATEAYRDKRRVVTCTLDCRVEDQTLLYAFADPQSGSVPTAKQLTIQAGTATGKIWLFHAPNVEWDVPTTPDPDDVPIWSFKGVCMETSGNDELILGQG